MVDSDAGTWPPTSRGSRVGRAVHGWRTGEPDWIGAGTVVVRSGPAVAVLQGRGRDRETEDPCGSHRVDRPERELNTVRIGRDRGSALGSGRTLGPSQLCSDQRSGRTGVGRVQGRRTGSSGPRAREQWTPSSPPTPGTAQQLSSSAAAHSTSGSHADKLSGPTRRRTAASTRRIIGNSMTPDLPGQDGVLTVPPGTGTGTYVGPWAPLVGARRREDPTPGSTGGTNATGRCRGPEHMPRPGADNRPRGRSGARRGHSGHWGRPRMSSDSPAVDLTAVFGPRTPSHAAGVDHGCATAG